MPLCLAWLFKGIVPPTVKIHYFWVGPMWLFTYHYYANSRKQIYALKYQKKNMCWRSTFLTVYDGFVNFGEIHYSRMTFFLSYSCTYGLKMQVINEISISFYFSLKRLVANYVTLAVGEVLLLILTVCSLAAIFPRVSDCSITSLTNYSFFAGVVVRAGI